MIRYIYFYLFFTILVACTSNEVKHLDKKELVTNGLKNGVVDSPCVDKELINDSSQMQIFKMRTQKRTIIVGQYGTEIEVESRAFDKNYSNIKVELIECYTLADFVLNKLLTVTEDGKLLGSQGMIYLNFKDSIGNELQPKVGSVKIKFPVKVESKTKLFTGKRKNGFVKWELVEQNNMVSEKEKIKGTLVRMPVFVSCVGKGDDKKCDTTYKMVDTSSVKYKNWSVLKNQTNGWLNLDHYIDEITTSKVVVQNMTKRTFVVVMFDGEAVVYSAKIGDDLKSISLFDKNAKILFIDDVSDGKIVWALSEFKAGQTKVIKPIFSKTSSKEFAKEIKSSFGNNKVNGYNG